LTKNRRPLVSIIIPTFNSSIKLIPSLESVKRQTYEAIEVVVVDKQSRDKSAEIASSYTQRVYVVDLQERGQQSNFGFERSKGEYVYKIDSDFVLDPSLVEEAVHSCEALGYDAIRVHNTSDPSISFWAKLRNIERDSFIDYELLESARFMKRSVFERIGGFNPSLVAGEDYDRHNRLVRAGFKIGRIKAHETHIGEPVTLLDIARKHFYYGTTVSRFIRANSTLGVRQFSPIRIRSLSNARALFLDPRMTVGYVIYQVVRYGAGVVGLVVGRFEIVSVKSGSIQAVPP